MSAYNRLNLHVAVSLAATLFGWFNRRGNPDSHFYVRKDGTCLVPEHKVLTADLRWVEGGDVKVGDKLVGFDETGAGKSGGRKYKETTVEWIERDKAEVYAVVMDDETIVYTTADHRWLAQSNESWSWRKTKDSGRTLVGAKVPRLFDVWEQKQGFEDGWFAGILDGEGHLGKRHRVQFSQRPTAVLERATNYLDSEGYDYTKNVVDGGRGDCISVDILGNLSVKMKLLGSLRPSRLLPKVDISTWGLIRTRYTDFRKVVAVYSVGTREIVKMQTSSRTFVAEGFGMHNCVQYVDTKYRANADLEGNDATISVETEGGVKNANGEPWTQEQKKALAELYAWVRATHGIPNKIAQDAKIGASSHGLSSHRLGIDGNFPPAPSVLAGRLQLGGGMFYSRSRGKICPGDAKLRQLAEIFQLSQGGKPTPPKDNTSGNNLTPVTGEIAEDSWWGPATTGLAQKLAGHKVDKTVSRQPSVNKVSYLGTGWDWQKSSAKYKGGSLLIKYLQTLYKKAGFYKGKLDGWAGPQFWRAFRKAQKAITHKGAIKKFQHNLNNGKFY